MVSMLLSYASTEWISGKIECASSSPNPIFDDSRPKNFLWPALSCFLIHLMVVKVSPLSLVCSSFYRIFAQRTDPLSLPSNGLADFKYAH